MIKQDELNPGFPHYKRSLVYSVSLPIQLDVLRNAFSDAIVRHQILRTTFHREPRLLQRVHKPYPMAMTRVPVSGGLSEALELVAQEHTVEFGLSSLPLHRVKVYELGSNEFVFCQLLQAMFVDFVSWDMVISEVLRTYSADLNGNRLPAQEAPGQYAAYAAWQRAFVTQDRIREAARFFANYLAGQKMYSAIGGKSTDVSAAEFREAVVSFKLTVDETGQVKRAAAEWQMTPAALCLSAFSFCMHTIFKASNVVCGALTSTRTRPEFANTAGYFANTLPVRLLSGPVGSFHDVAADVWKHWCAVMAFREIPFTTVIDELPFALHDGRSPAFSIQFNYEPYRYTSPILDSGLRFFYLPKTHSPYALALTIQERSTQIYATLVYDAAVFSEAIIEEFVCGFCALLNVTGSRT